MTWRLLWASFGALFLINAYRIFSGDYAPPSWLVATAWLAIGLHLITDALPGDD